MATAPAFVTPAVGDAERLELADVVRTHGEQYRRTHVVSSEQLQALSAIETCRTSARGGHLERCDHCDFARAVYHSCRNRHCPKCQVLAKERWLEQRRADLLPVQYFHVVFTLPHELNTLARQHPRRLHAWLFRCAAETLQDFAGRHLGGTLGITAILHTWSQTLLLHPHVHCLVTGAALAPDGSWKHARPRFLFAVRALSLVFRAKMLEALQDAMQRGDLPPEALECKLLRRVRRKRWVVYCKPPFAGPEQVLSYLGRYTHRIALSNDRLVALRDGIVAFRHRDRAAGRTRIMELPAEQFLGRFLQHVLPHRFVRIRHFGLHANRSRRESLARCRDVLGAAEPTPRPQENAEQLMLRLTGIDLSRCPACRQGRLRTTRTLEPGELLVLPRAPPDTS